MESSESTSSRRTVPAQPPKVEDDKLLDEKAQKERTDKEIAERVASAPEPPTPTQAEADAFKEGVVEGATGVAREQRDVKPGTPTSGYQTR